MGKFWLKPFKPSGESAMVSVESTEELFPLLTPEVFERLQCQSWSSCLLLKPWNRIPPTDNLAGLLRGLLSSKIVSYSCNGPTATSGWGEEQLCRVPREAPEDVPFPRDCCTPCSTQFTHPLTAQMPAQAVAPCTGPAGRGWALWKLPEPLSAPQLLLPFLWQHKRCNNREQNHDITVASLIQCTADWLYFLWEWDCLKGLWKNISLRRFAFQLLMQPITKESEALLCLQTFLLQ